MLSKNVWFTWKKKCLLANQSTIWISWFWSGRWSDGRTNGFGSLQFSRQNFVVKNGQRTSQLHCPCTLRLFSALSTGGRPSQEELDEEEAELEAGSFEHAGWEAMSRCWHLKMKMKSRNGVRNYRISMYFRESSEVLDVYAGMWRPLCLFQAPCVAKATGWPRWLHQLDSWDACRKCAAAKALVLEGWCHGNLGKSLVKNA